VAITASQLRQDVYRLLDQALRTGEPLEIERKGRILRIVPDPPRQRSLEQLHPIPGLIVGDPEELVSTDWSANWEPERAQNP
jgi:hypothetical protein